MITSGKMTLLHDTLFQPENSIRKKPTAKKQNIVQRSPYCQETEQETARPLASRNVLHEEPQ
jgi:hypothetical protein